MSGLRFRLEQRRLGAPARAALSLCCALGSVLALGSLIFFLAGASPLAAWAAMAQGALGSAYSLGEILVKAAPLTLTGLAVALCCRLNLWNIGAEGQFVLGAVCACWAALFAPACFPGWWPGGAPSLPLALPAALLAGMAGGAAWALVPALLKARLGVSEILSTLLLNYVAALLMEHLYYGPWRDPEGMGFPGTAEVPELLRLPTLFGTRAHWGLPLAVALALTLWWLLARTRWGFRARVLGESPKAAAYAGFRAGRITVTALCLSGALVGLAGAGELLGVQHRLQDGLATGLGFSGIIVAFLARLSLPAVPFAALLLGALLVGADQLQTGLRLPGTVVLALQAALLFGVLLGEFLAGTRVRLVASGGGERAGEGGHV